MIQCNIDDREGVRGKRAFTYFADAGFDCNISELLFGDYVFCDNNLTVAFEYKTMEDYLGSLSDNRVFNQALNQSNNYDYHFVIMEGTSDDRKKLIKEKERYTGRYITNKQFFGSIASLVNVTSILQADNEKQCFLLMELVVKHCLDLKPVLKRFKKSRGTPALRLLSNNVNRVGYITAEKICNDLGLVSVADVLNLDFESLVTVDGVGEKTALSILEQLNTEFK